jgi:Domain of unknown function (DUF4406)
VIYVAGAIKGTNDYHERFAEASEKLRAQGWSVFNPAAANQEGRPLDEIMAHLLPILCRCKAIALLPGWSLSGGASIEYNLAKYLGLEIIWL